MYFASYDLDKKRTMSFCFSVYRLRVPAAELRTVGRRTGGSRSFWSGAEVLAIMNLAEVFEAYVVAIPVRFSARID